MIYLRSFYGSAEETYESGNRAVHSNTDVQERDRMLSLSTAMVHKIHYACVSIMLSCGNAREVSTEDTLKHTKY